MWKITLTYIGNSLQSSFSHDFLQGLLRVHIHRRVVLLTRHAGLAYGREPEKNSWMLLWKCLIKDLYLPFKHNKELNVIANKTTWNWLGDIVKLVPKQRLLNDWTRQNKKGNLVNVMNGQKYFLLRLKASVLETSFWLGDGPWPLATPITATRLGMVMQNLNFRN